MIPVNFSQLRNRITGLEVLVHALIGIKKITSRVISLIGYWESWRICVEPLL